MENLLVNSYERQGGLIGCSHLILPWPQKREDRFKQSLWLFVQETRTCLILAIVAYRDQCGG
jgi:hypothetical protein